MRRSNRITWARPRVYFGLLLLLLFAIGVLCLYASSFEDRPDGRSRSDLSTVGAAMIGLSVAATAMARLLKGRLLRDE
jgi:hypothetical protein